MGGYQRLFTHCIKNIPFGLGGLPLALSYPQRPPNNPLTCTGVRKSANWPGNYPNDLDQELDPIVVAQGIVIFIEFTDFDIEDHSSCGYDYLMIEDGDGTVLMEKSCGTSLPANIRSKTNVVKLRFKTDDSEVRRGWRFMWSAVLPSERIMAK